MTRPGSPLGRSAISIDPQLALEDWLRRQPGGAAAVAVLTRSRAFSHFVAAAPGAKELVTIGKSSTSPAASARPGLVVADGPSTGHALGMLAAPHTLGEIAPLGSVAGRRVNCATSSATRRAGYVGVALPEEMAVERGPPARARTPGTIGCGLDLIVVNGLYPDRFSDEEAERLRARRLAGRRPSASHSRSIAARARTPRTSGGSGSRPRRRS